MKATYQESKMSLTNIHESILPQTPPWIIKKPDVILKLNELPKTKTLSALIRRNSAISSNIILTTYVFMDGSKDNDKTGCIGVINKTIIKKALPMESSIFTTEAHAIDLALSIISKSKQ